jgi:transposase-like protein
MHDTKRKLLIAEINYPHTYKEFKSIFPDENSCIKYLYKLRWNDGFFCPKCNTKNIPWKETRNRLVCPSCRHQTSITAGTIFEKTRTPLLIWFKAAFYMTSSHNGMSAKKIEQTLGISYRTVWTMLHRFRIAMASSKKEMLSGEIKVYKTFIHDKKIKNRHKKSFPTSVIAIAIEDTNTKRYAHIRMYFVKNTSSRNLIGFIKNSVTPGSTVNMIGWSGGYSHLESFGRKHNITVVSSSPDHTHNFMKEIEQITSKLQNWIYSTIQGSHSKNHLQSYLEEFTFHHNHSKKEGLAFRKLLEYSIHTIPITGKDMTSGYNWNAVETNGNKQKTK